MQTTRTNTKPTIFSLIETDTLQGDSFVSFDKINACNCPYLSPAELRVQRV